MVTFRMFITQLSLAVFDDLTHHKASSELLRLTLDTVFLHVAPAASHLPGEEPGAALFGLHRVELCCGDLQLDNQLHSQSSFHFAVLVCQEEKPDPTRSARTQTLLASSRDLEEYKKKCFIKLCLTLTEGESFLCDINEFSFELKPARLYVEDTFVHYIKTLFETYLPGGSLDGWPPGALQWRAGAARAGQTARQGLGEPSEVAETGDTAGESPRQHPRVPEAVHSLRPHSALLLGVRKGAPSSPRPGSSCTPWQCTTPLGLFSVQVRTRPRVWELEPGRKGAASGERRVDVETWGGSTVGGERVRWAVGRQWVSVWTL